MRGEKLLDFQCHSVSESDNFFRVEPLDYHSILLTQKSIELHSEETRRHSAALCGKYRGQIGGGLDRNEPRRLKEFNKQKDGMLNGFI
jgi:hypothetical protein